ncbi:MAG: HNH endonuclease [Candidatus Anammoximicrobium sp.]|nr:HNH endonuclease [Candidatus Anammoximicrobium sp.]
MVNSDIGPFTYRPDAAARRHGPDGYGDYRSYRPWLRDEFSFRCVYCLIRERWGHVTGQFDLDHFVPQVRDPEQPAKYENLIYACHACNLRKGDQNLPDAVLTSENVRVYEDGRIVGLTPDAERTIRLLWLNTPQTIQWRRIWIRNVQLARDYDEEHFRQLMGYPDDLPDLSRLAAPSNSRPDGIQQSCHARRERGELPDTYLY